MKAHDAQVQKLDVEALIAGRDGTLAVQILTSMSCDPRPANFEALGKILRAGIEALGPSSLDEVFIRRPRKW